MIAEALEKLFSAARLSAEPRRILDEDPRVARFVVDGKVVREDVAPSPRDHCVGRLEDVVALANRFAEGDGRPVVWYDEMAVRVVLDDDKHREEFAAMTLQKSATFTLLDALRAVKPWHDQKPFVRLLRIDLAGTGDDVARLLEAVRRVRFENGVTTTGERAHQRESLGREIVSKVESAAGAIPEEVAVELPVYSTAGERARYGVRCAVDVDPALGKFQLVPLPDELDRVVQLHLADVRDRLERGLATVEVPIYAGRP